MSIPEYARANLNTLLRAAPPAISPWWNAQPQ
jgi:hypothetical protein